MNVNYDAPLKGKPGQKDPHRGPFLLALPRLVAAPFPRWNRLGIGPQTAPPLLRFDLSASHGRIGEIPREGPSHAGADLRHAGVLVTAFDAGHNEANYH